MCQGSTKCRQCNLSGIMQKRKTSKSKIGSTMKKNNSTFQTAGGVIAGAFASTLLNKIPFISSNKMIGGAVKAGLGFVLSGQSNGIVKGIGLGMIAGGGMDLLQKKTTTPTAVSGIGYLNSNASSGYHRVTGALDNVTVS